MKSKKLEDVHIELRDIPKSEYGIACDKCVFKCNNYFCSRYNDRCSDSTAFILVAD